MEDLKYNPNKNEKNAADMLLSLSSDLFDNQLNQTIDHCHDLSSNGLKRNWEEDSFIPFINSTTKSSVGWTTEEEAIIIREYEKDPIKYAQKAKEYLLGRSKGAIIKRWNMVLKRKHPSIFLRTNSSWTPDEDEVIIREHKKNPNRFIKNATEYISGRSKGAIGSRWKNVLRKKLFPNLITRTNANWTPDEDEIIIREYEKNPNRYSKIAAKHLTGRSSPAIIIRLNKILKSEVEAT